MKLKHTELHLHTHYSLLDGVGTPREYLDRAAELGMTHLAITDHGTLSGHREFQSAAKEVGITPVLGCLMPGQEIHTIGGVKRVEDINEGDLVLTHTGSFRKVLSTMSRLHEGDVYKIYLARNGSRPLVITDEHPVLVDDGLGGRRWTRADELTAGRKDRRGGFNWNSYAVVPKTSRSENVYMKPVFERDGFNYFREGGDYVSVHPRAGRKVWAGWSRPIEVTEEIAWFLGVYVAEGSTYKDGRGQCTLTFNISEEEYSSRVGAVLEGLGVSYKIYLRPEKSIREVVFCHGPLSRMLGGYCGIGAKNKKVPEFMYTAKIEIIISFLRGLADGDGRYRNNGAVYLKTSSLGLAWGVKALVVNIGTYTEVKRVVSRLNGEEFEHYSVTWTFNSKFKRSIETDDAVLVGIRTCEKEFYSGPVYNFEVEGDNSYVTDFSLHNCEAYITHDRFDRTAAAKREEGDSVYNHLTTIAINENGLSNLNKLSAEAWRSGFYSKSRADFELLEEYSEDIVALSGCMSGMIPRALLAGDQDKARSLAEWFKRVYGDRFFIEVMGANPKELNLGLMQLAENMGIRPVVTSDCHHVRKEDLWLQEAMLIVSTKPTLNKDFEFSKSQKMDYLDRYNYLYPNRTMTFQDFDLHLKSYSEHMSALAIQGIGTEPIDNTNLIAEMVTDYPYHEKLDLLPNITKEDPDVALRKLVERGMRERGHEGVEERQERIDYELSVIKEKGFARYFLILEDIVAFAKSKDIFVGPGRGSAVSSLVVYYLGVGGIDPMEYNLLFARFLDPSRPDNPDVDLDFEMNRRHEVKEYAVRKFGHVASIITFGYVKDNGAVRDAASVLKIPLTEVNKALKMVDTWEGFMTSPTTEEFRRKYPECVKLAEAMRGRIRQSGMHAGGLVLSAEPVENYAPIQTAEDKQDPAAARVPIIAYDMRDAEQIGLIKYDILGLKTLTIIQDTLNDIKDRHGYDIDLHNIDLEDEKVYEMISSGAVRGIFQVEGAAYAKLIVKMGGVANFNELVASNALVRPGAANSSFGAKFIEGKNGGEVNYIHKDVKWFTEDTYSSVLYQEQLMHLCTDLAGMTVEESNKVRRAISKRKADELALWKDKFIEGASIKIGDKAEALWKDLEASADYQFNKAHAVGYSLLGYWTAWLKYYYPVEFMKNTIQYADEDMRVEHLMEAKRLGIKIMIPHVNKSDIYNTLEGDSIRLGLETVKGIKEKLASNIIRHRPYASYEELIKVKNTRGSGINATAISNLNKIGGAKFDDNPLKGDERDHFYEVLKIPSFEVKSLPAEIRLQFTPVDDINPDEAQIVLAMVKDVVIKGWCRVDFVDESGSAGAFTNPSTVIEKGNMYVMLIANNRIVEHTTPNDLVEKQDSAFAKFIMTPSLSMKEGEYRCISYRERKTKNGQLQADVVLTNGDKELTSAMVFESTLDRYRMALASGTKIRPIWGETRNGGRFLKGLESGR